MVEISLEKGYSFTTMLIVLFAAISLVSLFYYRAYRELKRGQWQLLLGLRIVAIVLIILLLFKPVFSYYKELEKKPALTIAVDTSQSMSITDDAGGIPRFEQVRTQVRNWIDQLGDDFQIDLIAFDERARVLNSVEELPRLKPEGKATSISRALVAAAKVLSGEEAEGVILLSDGIHNSARDPLELAPRMPVPVYTVGVGASLKSSVSFRDVQVTAIDCPERMIVDNKARIRASVEGVGLAGRVVTVVLTGDDDTRMQQELTLDAREGPQQVEFEFTPQQKGRHVYTVSVQEIPEEKIKENNSRSAPSLVVEAGIRVLYIEGTLRAEYGALVDRFLAKDPDLEFYAMVQTRPNVFLRRTNVEDLNFDGIPSDEATIGQFDVIIIGDLDASYLQEPQQQAIIKHVREGAGLIMLGGYHSLGPGGYGETSLAEILPVEVGSRDIGQVEDVFLPQLTPEGTHHPIFANVVEFFPTQNAEPKRVGLPPLDGCTRIVAAKPGAVVLAVCPPADNMPVLTVMPVDKGRTAVFTADTTRKWQQGPRALDQESPFLRFWGQMVRWAAGRSDEVSAEASVTANTDKAYYEPDEAVRISAVVRNAEGEGTDKAKVSAVIRYPDAADEKITLTTVPGPGGHYTATYEPTGNGTLEIEVTALLGDQELKAEKIVVEVGRPYLEFEKLDLAEEMLAQIAGESGGRYVHISTADHLIDQLDRSVRKKKVYVERPLFWPPLFWALFVVVLTTEWVLRRRFQLR
ncbi:glutamine amidotransferase [Thermostilla marina]